MVGKKSGVAELLKQKMDQKFLIVWHCLKHRLELAVHDTIVEINAIKHFKDFMESISTVYSQSPKNTNELKTNSASLKV